MWQAASGSFEITSTVVHLWRAALDVSPEVLARLAGHLSKDESDRAARFVFPRDRDRFVAARGILRDILGRYIQLHPADVRFSYEEAGKPTLAADLQGSGLRFNLAHSRSLALYALAKGRDVGVDIEFIRPELADEEIAERFFSPTEVAELQALPASERTAGFFRCWTRKEAYIKARGGGLRIPLRSFHVSVAPEQPARLLGVQGDPAESARWSICDVDAGPDCQAALVIEGPPPVLCLLEWSVVT